jgi:hypothetical protein
MLIYCVISSLGPVMDTWYVQLITLLRLLTTLLYRSLRVQNCKHSKAKSHAALTSLLNRLPLQLAMRTNRRRTGLLEDERDVQDRCCHALIPEARGKPRMGNLYTGCSHHLTCIDAEVVQNGRGLGRHGRQPGRTRSADRLGIARIRKGNSMRLGGDHSHSAIWLFRRFDVSRQVKSDL